jgi:hypothetical protein
LLQEIFVLIRFDVSIYPFEIVASSVMESFDCTKPNYLKG